MTRAISSPMLSHRRGQRHQLRPLTRHLQAKQHNNPAQQVNLQKLHRQCRATPRSRDSGLYIITLQHQFDAMVCSIPDRLSGICTTTIMDNSRPFVLKSLVYTRMSLDTWHEKDLQKPRAGNPYWQSAPDPDPSQQASDRKDRRKWCWSHDTLP